MTETLLIGRGKNISKIARADWEAELQAAPEAISRRLDFMSPEHHAVRNFVVREMPRFGKPFSIENIADELRFSERQTARIVEDLERNLFFLARRDGVGVSWAFPVTIDRTEHHLVFSTGERLDAAWAEDAIATPFVQGHLRNSFLEVEIRTICAHCGEAMVIVVDSELNYRIEAGGPKPLVFEPTVDWSSFPDPTIIDGYWNKNLFFWSEEHALEFRRNTCQMDGTYLTLDQSCYSTRIVQGALFAFEGLE